MSTLTPLEAFRLADFNAKEHDLPAIMESLERFGFGNPLVIDTRTGQLVAGHGRLEAVRMIRDEGMAPPAGIVVENGIWHVPTHEWESQDDAEALAFGLALNKTQDAGGWDDSALDALLADLGEDRGRIGLGLTEHQLQVALGNVSSQQSPASSSGTSSSTSRLVLTGDAAWHRRMVAYLRAAAGEFDAATPAELVVALLEEAYA